MRSIQQHLLTTILSIFLLFMILIAAFLWWRSSAEINQVFDNDLSQIATLIGVIALHEEEEQDIEDLGEDLHEHGYEFPIIFQAWSKEGVLLLHGPGTPLDRISQRKTEGFSDVEIDGEAWRVYTLNYPGYVHLVHVAQAYSIRNALVREFALNTLMPIILLTPFLGLLGFAISRGLAPLHWLAQQISNRDQGNLDQLPTENVPIELSVMVNEINALFERLKEALERYSRFTSNVAHELRNPIGGVIAQAHSAMNANDETSCRHSLTQVVRGSQKLSHIIDQLLTLARIHPDRLRNSFTRFDLHAITVEVMSELTPAAIRKGLEIELAGEGPLPVQGNHELTGILLSNLIRNAIHATPAAGQIRVSLAKRECGPVIEIEDSGPGIPEAEREKIFERFYRLPENVNPGSGLGLSIVEAIIKIHAGSIALSTPERRSGLIVTIHYPATAY
ncbi:MAG: ATP-binding protein [Gammaproteobacteria bacterium]|nr:ATP-binding protein [Gammaproteobacteria bacterium]